MDAAEILFARHGYGPTSMRMVVERAKVNLGAIHYHFGSKQALFDEVVNRRLEPLAKERELLLETHYLEKGKKPPELEQIVEAFLRPSFELAARGPAGASWVKLVARYRLDPGPEWSGALKLQARSLRLFQDALQTALPHLPPQELAYRVFFTLGATANTMVEAGTTGLSAIHEVLATGIDGREGLLSRLIDFVVAGLRSPLTQVSPKRRKED